MRKLLAVAASTLLSGCVLASTKMLDERTAVISARGGAANDMADVAAKVFEEAAKLCTGRGYAYFEILSAADASQAGAFMTPGQSYTNASASAFGNTVSGTATTTYVPGQVIGFVKPGQDVMVRLLRETDPRTGQGVFNCASVAAAQAANK